MAEFKPRRRKKVCAMCEGHVLDYKNAEDLKKYINEKGKILPRRVTGTCAKHQRHIAEEVKKARFMGFVPFCK